MLKHSTSEPHGLSAPIALKDKRRYCPSGRKNMKSAKNKKLVSGCLAVILSLICLFSGCECSSFRPDVNIPNEIQSGNHENISTDTPTTQPNPPLFYDRFTGLACDESIASCRPLAVCISNFDGKSTKGLSYADVLIETPYDANTTRVWALSANWNTFAELSNISTVRSYMFPMINAFSAICAFAGTDGTQIPSSVNGINQGTGEFSDNFTSDASGQLSSTGASLLNAAVKKNYAMSYSGASLPFQFNTSDSPYTPVGNRISSIHFQYSQANTVDFTYDSTSGIYWKSQSGEAHTDSATGTQLSFSNVLLLFYNVSYYHTASGTTFTLDTAAGGNGFCYTGGHMMPISWHYDNTGNLIFTDSEGQALTLNKGKTYIGMMKITDSSVVVAK